MHSKFMRDGRRLLMSTVLALVCFVAGAGAQESEGRIAGRLLEASLEPVAASLNGVDGVRGIALEQPAGSDADRLALHDAVGNFFHRSGIAFWSIASGDSVPAGAALLELELQDAGVEYPARRKGWFGLRSDQTQRKASVRLRASLTGSDGLWIYRGAPSRDWIDWVATDQTQELSVDRPRWLNGRVFEAPEPSTGWLERGLVVGLVTGVAVLYFDGAR